MGSRQLQQWLRLRLLSATMAASRRQSSPAMASWRPAGSKLLQVARGKGQSVMQPRRRHPNACLRLLRGLERAKAVARHVADAAGAARRSGSGQRVQDVVSIWRCAHGQNQRSNAQRCQGRAETARAAGGAAKRCREAATGDAGRAWQWLMCSRLRRSSQRNVPRGTWLTLPDPPMNPAKAALVTPLAPTDGPASEPVAACGAATCGGTATADTPHDAWQELPDMPFEETGAALEAPSALEDSTAARTSELAARDTPHNASPTAPETPAKALRVALSPPPLVSEGRSEDTSSRAARGWAATAECGPQNTQPRLLATPAGATGAAGRTAPHEVDHRLIAVVCSATPSEDVTTTPQGDERLSQPARTPEPWHAHAHMGPQSSVQVLRRTRSRGRLLPEPPGFVPVPQPVPVLQVLPAAPQKRAPVGKGRASSQRSSCSEASALVDGSAAKTSASTPALSSEPAARDVPRSASSMAPQTPAKAPCVGPGPPSVASTGRSTDISSAAARGGLAVMGSAPDSTRPRLPDMPAGATGAAERIAPFEIENRLIAGVYTMVGDQAVPSTLLDNQRLSQPAGTPGPEQSALQSPSVPSQIEAAATMAARQGLARQLEASVSPSDGRRRSAHQRPETPRARVGGVPPLAVPRPKAMCRFCGIHGVETTYSSAHRAASEFSNRCGCFRCRQLRVLNDLEAESKLRGRKAAAAATVAARQQTAEAAHAAPSAMYLRNMSA